MKRKNNLEILDCTIRDGGYVNNWNFNKKLVREIFRALSKSGIDFIELGFRGSKKHLDQTIFGPWRFTTEDDLREVTEGIKGIKISVMGDYVNFCLDDLEDKNNSLVEMVRIAANKNFVYKAIDLLAKIKSTKGYITSLQAMGFSSYTLRERLKLKNAVKGSGLDYFYVADSYGSIYPNEIKLIFEPFLRLGDLKVGFHPHNNLQMAFANTLEAIKTGVDIVDSSIYGMGRGAGNLPTEALVAFLSVHGDKKYNVVPILSCIYRYFVEIMKKTPWGYQLPYMISGVFKCHPYYAAELIKRHEYLIEDIWRTLEIIKEINPIGFERSIIDQLIKKGIAGNPNSGVMVYKKKKLIDADHYEANPTVSYVNRNIGRDFLILANGPTLKEYQNNIQAFIKKYDPVVLGANYIGGLFEPDYHAFNNKNRFEQYIDTVNPRSKLLIGENISREMILEYMNRDYEILYFKDTFDSDFDIKDGRIQSNCRTISILLLGVAIVMGAKRIFAVGMDGYIDKKKLKKALFYDEKLEPDEDNLIIDRHYWNERFLYQIDQYIQERNGEGIHILTPTSHHYFYKGIANYL